MIFSTALKASATKDILSHNHPSEKMADDTHDFGLKKKAIEMW